MKPASLIVAYLHGGEVAHSFHHSCRNLWSHDLLNNQRLTGFIAQECGAGRITDGRNEAVGKFLKLDAEWLAFVDSDMGFDPDTFDRLIEAADPVQRPIVGALAFGQRRAGLGAHGSVRLEQYPTIYRWVDGAGISGCASLYDYPADTLVECDATGAACFIVHRTVLVAMAEHFPSPRHWFDEMFHKGRFFGEDLTFFLRCKQLGYPVHVHTGIQTSHYKHSYLSEDTQPLLEDTPTYVVIPMKDRMDLTRSLLEQLATQDEYAGIVVLDNGSSEHTKAELYDAADLPPRVQVIDAAGWNIHQMWNAGINEAVRLSRPCNIAILNNDLKIGPKFLSGLARPLRSDPLLAAVSPNYDGRDPRGADVQYVADICADRYDGTGGLAGFAFMIKEESNYRFPEQLRWWYGDNHMLANIHYSGMKAGIVLGTTCEHIGGGSQTGRWDDPEIRPVLEADRRWFTGWLRSMQPAAERHVFVLWPGCGAVDQICEDIAERFTVLESYEIDWPDFAGTLSRFYGTDASAKATQLTRGPSTVLVVRDEHPVCAERDTTRGRRAVNTNLFDAKQRYRAWSGNPETVHASDTADEASENLGVLFPGFATLEAALAAIPCDYVVLRNFQGEDTGDVDLLVEDLDEAVLALDAIRLHPEPHRVAYTVRIAGKEVPFDLRHVDDGYYDAGWQADILRRRVQHDDTFSRPCDDDWYWSLLYHALHHKGTLGGYLDTLEQLRPGGSHTQRALSTWMDDNGYRYVRPDDVSVPLAGVVIGRVASGFGAAARDVAAGWYTDALPYVPYAGTLNLTVTGRVSLPGPGEQLSTPDGRQLMLWPARVRGVDCHLMIGGDGRNTVELLAPTRLRDAWQIVDGDEITVEVVPR